jgi:hypothetical protein
MNNAQTTPDDQLDEVLVVLPNGTTWSRRSRGGPAQALA